MFANDPRDRGSISGQVMPKTKKMTHLLGELSNLRVNASAVQETHFTCTADCRVQEVDFVVLSVYVSNSSVGVSLLVGRSLNTDLNLVFADDGGHLVVADVVVQSFEFRVASVYAPNIGAERISLFQRLVLFLNEMKGIVLMGD